MKNMLILGGNSKKNITWLKKMVELYKSEYNVKTVEYDNWQNDKEMDFDYELEKIRNMLLNNDVDIIIAKSIGLIFISYIARNINIKNKTIVFMGYPMNLLEKENIDITGEINKLSSDNKLLIIQEDKDPLGSYEDVYKVLNKVNVIKIDGNDHSYNNITHIKKHINNFIKPTVHEMKLQDKYFDYILYGTKRIELRLNDEKRSKIKVGDKIRFLKMSNLTDELIVDVEELLKYSSFDELFKDYDISILSDKSMTKKELKKVLEEFYTKEMQDKYGVLGIKIKLNK